MVLFFNNVRRLSRQKAQGKDIAMNNLNAIFSGNIVDRLLPLYLRKCEEDGSSYNLAAGNTWGDNSQQVRGPAQEVMFFIGFVAAQGEDGLLSVRA